MNQEENSTEEIVSDKEKNIDWLMENIHKDKYIPFAANTTVGMKLLMSKITEEIIRQALDETYTDEDLEELVEHYKTDLGQKSHNFQKRTKELTEEFLNSLHPRKNP